MRAGREAAVYLSAIAGLLAVVQPLTDCVPTRQSITFQVKNTAISGPRAVSRISKHGRLVFALAALPLTYSYVTIPLSSGHYLAGGCRAGLDIDLSDEQVLDVTATLTAGDYSDPFGALLGPVCAGYAIRHI